MYPVLGSIAGLALAATAAEREYECQPIKDMYESGTELCEMMWSDSFEVVDDAVKSYNMRFFDGSNPNDAVSKNIFNETILTEENECYIKDYYHKPNSSAEADLGACEVYRKNGCCKADKVTSYEVINNLYGADYHWDRCGPMSKKCEAYFLQEACFYECDVNVGYWRKFYAQSTEVNDNVNRTKYVEECNPDTYDNETEGEEFVENNPDECVGGKHNRWQLYKMPIKRSFCDNMYAACKDDLFCGGKHGSYFDCKIRPSSPPSSSSTYDVKAIVGVLVASGVAIIAGIVILYLVYKERVGRPVFTKIEDGPPEEEHELGHVKI